jgi:hypothetical protein
VADPARRRTGRPGPRPGAGCRHRRTGPGRSPRRRCRPRRPPPLPPWRGRAAPRRPLVGAVSALGPVPGHPQDRLDWQRRAASVGAWRELSGYDHPADPIGPEPVAAAPDLRASWHEALAALGPADGPHVRGMPGGMLLHLRYTYPTETTCAPQYAGGELRQVRAAAWDARLAAIRAAAEAAAARRRGQPGQPGQAARQQELAASYRACTTPTGTAKLPSPPSWPTGPTGMPPPAPGGTWPWPPRLDSAAATPTTGTRRCAPPNPRPPPKPSGTSSP